MKKLVLILSLFFASVSFMKANTISQQNQDVEKKVAIDATEKYDIGGSVRMHCTTTSTTSYYENGDGSFDIITVSHTHCEPVEVQ